MTGRTFHTLVQLDVAGSGSFDAQREARMREELQRLVHDIATTSELDVGRVGRRDTGDGLLLTIPPDVMPPQRVVDRFIARLCAGLREHRRIASPAMRLRMRAAFDVGLVGQDGAGWTGPPLVRIARLVDAGPAKAALREHPEADLVVVLSDPLYREVVDHGFGDIDRAAYRKVLVRAKEFHEPAWLLVPDQPAPAPDGPTAVVGSAGDVADVGGRGPTSEAGHTASGHPAGGHPAGGHPAGGHTAGLDGKGRRPPRWALVVGIVLAGLVAGGSFLVANAVSGSRRDVGATPSLPSTTSSAHPSQMPTNSASPDAGILPSPDAGRPSASVSGGRPMEPTVGAPNGGVGRAPATGEFYGTILFEFPGFGNTLATGQQVYGSVTDWSAGFQVWLFVRPETSSAVTAQGPCQVDGGRWTCTNVKLAGPPGTREYLNVVVASDAEAATYPSLSTLPQAAARDETQAYKA